MVYRTHDNRTSAAPSMIRGVVWEQKQKQNKSSFSLLQFAMEETPRQFYYGDYGYGGYGGGGCCERKADIITVGGKIVATFSK